MLIDDNWIRNFEFYTHNLLKSGTNKFNITKFPYTFWDYVGQICHYFNYSFSQR